MICGGTISGNCASGNPSMAMRPPRTVMIAITIATIGRLMKKFEIIYPRAGRLLKRFRVHDHAGSYFLRSLDYNPFAGVQSFFNDPLRSDTLPDLDGTGADLATPADNGNLIGALQFAHGALRHEQRARFDFLHRPN